MSYQQEANEEYTLNVGREHPNTEWILSLNDTWHRNIFYQGPPTPHPEDDSHEDGHPVPFNLYDITVLTGFTDADPEEGLVF